MKKIFLWGFIGFIVIIGNAYGFSISSLDEVSRDIFKKGFFLGWQMKKREHFCGSYMIPSGWWVYMDSSNLSSYKIGYYKFLAMREGFTPLDSISSVVFGVFDNKEDATHAKSILEKSGVKGVIWVDYKTQRAIINPCVNASLEHGKTHLDKVLYYMELALEQAKDISNPSVNKEALIHDISTIIFGLKQVGAKTSKNNYYKSTITIPPNYENLIERSKLWAK